MSCRHTAYLYSFRRRIAYKTKNRLQLNEVELKAHLFRNKKDFDKLWLIDGKLHHSKVRRPYNGSLALNGTPIRYKG